MSEMVEQVAKALLAVREKRLAFYSSECKPEAWEEVPQWHGELMDDARAAVAAIREPTKAMAEAGDDAALADGAHDCEVAMADVWRAMVDAALK